ncbi:BTB/POZ protein [Auriculariales sp. MPI-PUGE-AT-0066]|nr:BTB/POZ protein [Auriculariales sp. MPI-PUGE-AT-0066]
MSDEKKDAEWVKLVGTDNFEFIVPREAALASPTLSDMLSMDTGFSEASSNTVHLDYRAAVLGVVAEYLMFRWHATQPTTTKEDISDFTERIPPELSLEVLTAADFLQT